MGEIVRVLDLGMKKKESHFMLGSNTWVVVREQRNFGAWL